MKLFNVVAILAITVFMASCDKDYYNGGHKNPTSVYTVLQAGVDNGTIIGGISQCRSLL